MAGIRARIRVLDHECPVARLSADGPPVRSVARSVRNGSSVVSEVTTPPGATVPEVGDVDDFEPVFSTDDGEVYRLVHDRDHDCVCRSIERFGHVTREIRAERGDLLVTFYAPDLASLREAMVTLKDGHDGVSMERLSRDGDDLATADPTVVDCDVLTDRQQEVLETAFAQGYFEYPKRANASEVADTLDISRSTFVEHLSTAQAKILGAVVDEV